MAIDRVGAKSLLGLAAFVAENAVQEVHRARQLLERILEADSGPQRAFTDEERVTLERLMDELGGGINEMCSVPDELRKLT